MGRAEVRGFFDEATNTISYLLSDPATRIGAVIDPVLGFEHISRYAQVRIERLQWTRLRLLDLYGDDRPR